MYSVSAWKQEMSQLHDVRFNWNDRLDVVNGAFQLIKGDSEKINGKLWIADPLTVAQHLESLITSTARKQLDLLKKNLENYEQIADFKREFRCLKDLISNLQCYLKPHEENLKDRSSALYNEIIEFKNSLVKPPLKDRPPKLVVYDERTELSSIKKTHPKRASIDGTVNAAITALRISEPNVDELYKPIVQSLFCCMLMASALKAVLWNPCEWMWKGKVTTSSPVQYIINDFLENRHIQALHKLANQLLRCEVFTEEAASAFAKLAPYVSILDLRIDQPQIDSYALGIVLGAATASKLCNKIHISNEFLKLPDVVALLYANSFEQSDNTSLYSTYIRKPYGT